MFYGPTCNEIQLHRVVSQSKSKSKSNSELEPKSWPTAENEFKCSEHASKLSSRNNLAFEKKKVAS